MSDLGTELIYSIESHKTFAEKFKLPYLLLSDSQSEIMKNYGAFGKK